MSGESDGDSGNPGGVVDPGKVLGGSLRPLPRIRPERDEQQWPDVVPARFHSPKWALEVQNPIKLPSTYAQGVYEQENQEVDDERERSTSQGDVSMQRQSLPPTSARGVYKRDVQAVADEPGRSNRDQKVSSRAMPSAGVVNRDSLPGKMSVNTPRVESELTTSSIRRSDLAGYASSSKLPSELGDDAFSAASVPPEETIEFEDEVQPHLPPLLNTPFPSLRNLASAPPAELLDLSTIPKGKFVFSREGSNTSISCMVGNQSSDAEECGVQIVPARRGWVSKTWESRRDQRFMILEGHLLSCHSSEDPSTSPIWQVDLRDCPVTPGEDPLELVVNLPLQPVRFLCESAEEREYWMAAVQKAMELVITDFYNMDQHLGSGSYGDVYRASQKSTGEKVAIKRISKIKFGTCEMKFLRREISITRKLRHPNIVSTFDIFDSKDTLYIVMEYMPGGEFFSVLESMGHFSERNAAIAMRDIVTGVACLHVHGIIHRDLKPENLLCTSKKWPLNIKIGDFGLAGYTDDERESTPIGTLFYMAPEVLKREDYGTEVDMWSLGVILYVILSGRIPFYGDTEAECIERIVHGVYSFPEEFWGGVSSDAVSLIRSLLQVDPKKRLTAKATLNHRWVAGNAQADTPIHQISNRSEIKSINQRFRSAALAALSVERLSRIISEKSNHSPP
uniref:Non-specific serine/threonine protein kinase n=1 Tax=Rhodosorus marinus TaxID=101924 RepID=A0A7S0G5Q7_9RHOD|mmetsp:Transcript_3438/g.4908  ORF Transcript_3438/g.4908 Transcript_3438/m.4908 type:complete len:678 (+) Transcript_3438:195-2228(+)|eukprot:CAMPEP_0184747208 /NCGR_PEP_ID=MMETSP0315-20130426/9548_1 /TAXON_ID=101924 /ORGANISM="Rhodosorus marinus, Strain UTEX LB 2760" /LENGTH=677 /DNA_ID=CAMNT_0027219983 /DNA_START=143 /DNA_END=2176 /DNA_ORIENTATION=+